MRVKPLRFDLVLFTLTYLAFLAWAFFVHKSQDFDYRPLADIAFFYFIAWLTVSELGIAQARAKILAGNFGRIQGILGRLVGSRLAAHLLIRGSLDEKRRHLATVMTIDLRYTNRMIKAYGAEQTLAVVDDFLTLVTACVEKNGGEVNKIMGDKVMAVWGLLAPDDKSCDGAVRAGLELRKEMENWNERRAIIGQPVLGTAVGVSTGPVVAGRIGGQDRSDYSVFGAVVGRSFALLEQAKMHAVDLVIDAATARTLGRQALIQPLPVSAEEESFALVAIVTAGVLQFNDKRWTQRFAALTEGGPIYDAGANQDAFVPDLFDQFDAA